MLDDLKKLNDNNSKKNLRSHRPSCLSPHVKTPVRESVLTSFNEKLKRLSSAILSELQEQKKKNKTSCHLMHRMNQHLFCSNGGSWLQKLESCLMESVIARTCHCATNTDEGTE